MQQFAVDGWTLLCQLLYYFPWYVGLVLIPMVIRVAIERAIGIRPEVFCEGRVEHPELPPRELWGGVSYEAAFREVVLSALYSPLFEELVFRGLPCLLFGSPGVVAGSAVWVAMHPAWQLQYLSAYPLRKRLAFTLTSTCYYAANAAFYSMMWLSGAGLAAILYHMAHNGWLTLAGLMRRVELPAPWRRYRFVRRRSVGGEAPPALRLLRRLIRGGGRREEEAPPLRFVVRGARRTLADEVEEARSLMYVRRKANSEE